MQNIKKLAVMVLALCVTMPLFALKIKDHPASQKAQAQLEADILGYLQHEQYQQIEKMIDHIYECRDIQNKVFKKGQAPYRCRYTYDDKYGDRRHLGWGEYENHLLEVPTVRIEGGSTQEIAGLDEYEALEKALNKRFAYSKKAGYLDYNKFVAFYKQLPRFSWLWTNAYDFLGRDITIARKNGKVPFDKLAIVSKLSSVDIIRSAMFSRRDCETWSKNGQCFPYKKSDIDRWYSDAIDVYHDRATFRLVKWKLFEAGVGFVTKKQTVYPSTSSTFWENFAIQPPFTQTMKQQKQAQIEKTIRTTYDACVARKRTDCHYIKTYAQKYGFWKETAAERQQRMTAEMRGHIATQPKK